MKAYVAGPMSGLPDEGFPAFDAAAERLRAAGWEVVNPAELSRQHRAANPGRVIATNAYRDFLPRDIAEIATCDALVLLPGWERSRGVRVELASARLFGCRILDADGRDLAKPAGASRDEALRQRDVARARLRHLATTTHNAHLGVPIEACPAAVCRENVAALGGEL